MFTASLTDPHADNNRDSDKNQNPHKEFYQQDELLDTVPHCSDHCYYDN